MKLSSVMSHLTILYWHRHFLTNSIFKFFKSYKNTSLHTNSKVSAGQIYSIFARSRFWSPMWAETDIRDFTEKLSFLYLTTSSPIQSPHPRCGCRGCRWAPRWCLAIPYLYFSTHYFFILANLVTCQFCYRLLSVDRIYDGRYFLV